jgi:hypothetical protein
MTTQYVIFIISFCVGAIVPLFVRWFYDEMHKAKKPKTSTITPVFAKSELQMHVVRTAIQKDRLRLDDSDQVFEYAAKKLLRQIASIIKEQLMDNIEVHSDDPTNCMILEFTFWTRRPRQKVRDKE